MTLLDAFQKEWNVRQIAKNRFQRLGVLESSALLTVDLTQDKIDTWIESYARRYVECRYGSLENGREVARSIMGMTLKLAPVQLYVPFVKAMGNGKETKIEGQ